MDVPISVPVELLVYVGVITTLVEVLKKYVPTISTVGWAPRMISLALGVGAGFIFMQGDLETKIAGGIALGLASSGLFDNAKGVGLGSTQ